MYKFKYEFKHKYKVRRQAQYVWGSNSSLAVSCVRHEGNVSGTLDSDRENALMTRAVAADATWQNLAALCDELLQTVWIFVVYEIHFIGAKAACLTTTWW